MYPLINGLGGLLAGLWLVLGCLDALAAGGTVIFANNSSSKVVNGLSGNAINTNDNIQAALYWAPIGSSSFTQLGAATRVGHPLPGLFAAGTRTTDPATAGGTTAQFQVRAWGGGYPTYEDAQWHGGVMLGSSTIVQLSTGDPAAAPPAPPNSFIGLNRLALTPGGLPWLTLICASNKTAECGNVWSFDPPDAIDTCPNTNVTIIILSTETNGTCPQTITRTWQATDECNKTNTCSQTVTVATPPSFQSVHQSGGILQLAWSADPGLTYQLQYKTNLDQQTWINLSSPITATNATATVSDSIAPDNQRFYRIMLLPAGQ